MAISPRQDGKCVLVSGENEQDGRFFYGRFEGRQALSTCECALNQILEIADDLGIRETAHWQMRYFKIVLKENCPIEALERFREKVKEIVGVDFRVVFEDRRSFFSRQRLAPAA